MPAPQAQCGGTVYLHKHAGFSILPFIRGSLGLARPPHWQLPLAALPAAVSRVVSSFLSGCVLPWPGLVFSTQPPLCAQD